jgi:hypothetical protein
MLSDLLHRVMDRTISPVCTGTADLSSNLSLGGI